MPLERFRLDGQIALVTGGGRGIGLGSPKFSSTPGRL